MCVPLGGDMLKNERNDFMTDAKDEYFKFNPTYESKPWTDAWALDIIDECFFKSDIELSIVESNGKDGLIRTVINFQRDGRNSWWEEGIYPCNYDKITPLGCVAGVGLMKLQKGDEIKIVLMKAAAYPGGDEIVCFEVDV